MGRKESGKNSKEKIQKNKRWNWWLRIGCLFAFVYVIAGCIVPFIQQKEVSEEFKRQYKKEQFYSDGRSVDRAKVIETSKEAFDIRFQMIHQAKKQILLSTFSIKTDRASKEVCAALYEAAERGVSVQMLVDGLSGGMDMKNHAMYYALATHKNVEIRYYNVPSLLTPWEFNGRMHDKYLVIDDTQLLLGGRNTSNYFIGEYNTNVLSYDREVFVYNTADTARDSVIGQVQNYFALLWNYKETKRVFHEIPRRKKQAVQEMLNEYPVIYEELVKQHPEYKEESINHRNETIAVNKITLICNPIHIWSKEPYIWYTMGQLMKEANNSVLIQTPYAVMNTPMYQTMKEVSKNVETVDMLLNSVAVGDNICASSDYLFHREKIRKTGVHVYEFQGKHSMHNKSVVIDHDLSIIGSFNFDMRSAYLDTETMLVIHGEEFAASLTKEIRRMQEESILVLEDGTYDPTSTVEPATLKGKKKLLYYVTPYVFQLFRYLL